MYVILCVDGMDVRSCISLAISRIGGPNQDPKPVSTGLTRISGFFKRPRRWGLPLGWHDILKSYGILWPL